MRYAIPRTVAGSGLTVDTGEWKGLALRAGLGPGTGGYSCECGSAWEEAFQLVAGFGLGAKLLRGIPRHGGLTDAVRQDITPTT